LTAPEIGVSEAIYSAHSLRRLKPDPTSAILIPMMRFDLDAKMATIPAPDHAIARTHPVLWGHGGCRVGE